MKVVGLVQGSAEWHKFRAEHFTASDAPAMLGFSKYKTRDHLLAEKCEGVFEEITPEKQALFDKGHAAEESARPLVEILIGEELYPATAISDEWEKIAASFDGITMTDDAIWEHKLYNKKLIEHIELHDDLPDTHWPQVEHQLYVSGADVCHFRVSDGTEDNCYDFEYQSVPERAKRVINGWKVFEQDMQGYEPKQARQEVKAVTIDNLPDLFVEITGKVNGSNLAVYKTDALSLVRGINTDLKTDQDFADAEAMVKFCKKSEDNIKAVKSKAMEGAASINEVFTALNEIGEEMRKKRLELDKLVKSKKEEIKKNIVDSAISEMNQFIAEHESGLKFSLGFDVTVFRSAAIESMKRKQKIESIKSGVNDEVAKAKAFYLDRKELVIANTEVLEEYSDYNNLFADVATFIHQPTDQVKGVVSLRVREKKNREAKLKAEAEEKAKAAQEKKKDESAVDLNNGQWEQVVQEFKEPVSGFRKIRRLKKVHYYR